MIENSPNDIVEDILPRAQKILTELKQVLEQSLVRSPDGLTHIRRLVWFHNRTRAARLLEELRDIRANSMLALTADFMLDGLCGSKYDK